MRAALAVLLALALPLAASARELSVPWSDLRPYILNQKVTITTAQGSITGRVVSIADDTLTAQTGKTTQTIARTSLQTIRVTRYDGPARKIGFGAGFVAGLVFGLFAFIYFGLDETSSASVGEKKAKAIAAWLGTWVGMTLGGWLIGRLIDREVLVIRPVPAPPAAK
jgi:hypothetical protein